MNRLKIKGFEEVRERDDKLSLMQIRLKETEKLLTKAQTERETTFRRLDEAHKDIEVIYQIKKDVTDYERTIENLQRELSTCQEEKKIIEKSYRDLQTKTNSLSCKIDLPIEQVIFYFIFV